MMISHSNHAAGAGTPVRLLCGALRGGVSRLEFHPVERVMAETLVAADTSAEVSAPVPLTQEATAVDLRVEMEAQVEAARREARAEAREEWAQELEERVAMERARVSKACEEFGQERARYFAAVEAEVVRLALAIATRVLHREATMDALLLAGVVRVALEKVAEDGAVTLRVPAGAGEMWRAVVSGDGDLTVKEDERMEIGECVLETSVGRVELGVSAQLEEIEKGFFDLLQQRPA